MLWIGIIWDWIKDRNLHTLLLKYSAVGISYLVSHLVALTTTPDYAEWWARFYLTAPKITNIPAFEKMLTAFLLTVWLTLDHYLFKQVGSKQTREAIT